MSFSLSPVFNGWQGFGTTGLPLNAGLLYTYAAGTTTPAATYTTSVGNVQNANPIVLGPDGRPPQEIWLQDGLSYKFQLNDSLNNPIATYDNIQSIGTLIQNFVTSTAFLTQADGRYPIYVGTAGGSSDALTATVSTSITALYNGMVVSLDAVTANLTATPTFTLTLGSTVTPTLTIVDNNLQPLSAAAIAGLGHKIFLGYNSIQGKWLLMNPQTILPNAGIASKRQTASIGPKDISGMPSFLPQAVTGLTLTTQNIVGIETVQTANVTTPVASPGVVTWTGHTLVANQAISFTTNGSLPTGLTVGTTYYVLSPVANTFNVSATPGGAAINFTGSTSGQSVAWAGIQNVLVGTAYYGNDGINGELNLVGQATSNFSFPALTNNSTNYLYSTISNIGVFTHFATTLAPIVVYGSTTAPSITSGQITIDVLLCEAYLGNGSTAIETPMVIWGTATTSGGNITATQTYNYGKPPTGTTKLSGTLLRRTVYSTAGTFTWIKSAQTTSVNVKVMGGGGAGGVGGGTAASATSSGGGGGGGGGGGYAEGIFDASTFNSQTVTLASAGSSSFGSLISATAGATGGGGFTPGSTTPVPGGQGASGGTGAGGDIQITGASGGTGGTSSNGGSGGGGNGADKGSGAGGLAKLVAGNGNNGTNGVSGGGGGGGSGGFSGGSAQTGGTGGTGSVGWVIVEEYA